MCKRIIGMYEKGGPSIFLAGAQNQNTHNPRISLVRMTLNYIKHYIIII